MQLQTLPDETLHFHSNPQKESDALASAEMKGLRQVVYELLEQHMGCKQRAGRKHHTANIRQQSANSQQQPAASKQLTANSRQEATQTFMISICCSNAAGGY